MTHPRMPGGHLRAAALVSLLAMTAAVLIVPAGTAQDNAADATGVLAGLWDPGLDESDGRPPTLARLRTVWMTAATAPGAAAVRPPRNVPHLLIPRSSGFWRAGLIGECTQRPILDSDDRLIGAGFTIEEHLWAAPLGVRPTVHMARDSGERPFEAKPCAAARNVYCADTVSPHIFWVWPDYASLEFGSASRCGAHPDWRPGYTVRSWSQLDKPLSVAEALGPSAAQAFEAAFRIAYSAVAKDEVHGKCSEQAVFQPLSWHVERTAGRWKAEGWSDTHRLCGYGLSFAVETDLSPIMGKTGSGNRRSMATAGTANNNAGLPDAHPSPSGLWTLAVNKSGLALLPTDSRHAGPAIKVSKLARERVVMVEWATGATSVARRDRAVRRLLQTAEPPPKVVVRRITE